MCRGEKGKEQGIRTKEGRHRVQKIICKKAEPWSSGSEIKPGFLRNQGWEPGKISPSAGHKPRTAGRNSGP